MKHINSIDAKFKKKGFEKIQDDNQRVVYERSVKTYEVLTDKHLEYTYRISIACNEMFACLSGTNHTVGLTPDELKLVLKKMKKKGW